MKIKTSEADQFAAKPPAGLRGALIYGPDAGLIRERSKLLARAVLGDSPDPFRTIELSDAELKKDPARLSDEMSAISMFGGRRIVEVRGATDSLAPLAADALRAPGDAFLILEAGELTPRSALRKFFEEERDLAALACFADDSRTLASVIRQQLAALGIEPEPAALAFLVDHLGSDRGVTMRELEKLGLYMAAPSGARIRLSLEDARACIGDNATASIDALVDATAGGDVERLDLSLSKARDADVAPIAVLGALARHLQRLHLLVGRLEQGAALEPLLRGLRPPVHFSREAALKAQCRLWSRRRLERALGLVADAEAACKSTGMPDLAICGQTLIRIALAARQGRQRAA